MARGQKTGGRRKGSVNRYSTSVKEQLLATFNQLQEEDKVNLLDWARANPTEFYKLSAKLLPLQVETEAKEPGVVIQIIPDPNSLPILSPAI
jgi:UV DNA damage repair endonuclease